MSAENPSSYYTFVNPSGDTPAWTATHKSYRASQPAAEPIFVEAHIIDERDTPSGRKTTWANTGNNPSAGFQTSWTGTAARKPEGTRITGAIQTVAGLGLMVIGVPMLILPGPGLAVIAGGALLAGSGARKVLGRH